MKKIFLFLFLLIPIAGIAQEYAELDAALIVGSDTTLYLRNGRHNLLTIDFTTTNASTATLDVGLSDDRVSFVTVNVSGVTFPITLSKTTYTKTANGYTRNRVAFQSGSWPGTYIALKITKVDVTYGVYKIWY